MAWRCGSLSRSVLSTARASSIRSSFSRLHHPTHPIHSHNLHSRRSIFSLSRNSAIGALGCTQSLLPLHSVVVSTCLTSHIFVEARACCELSQGT